ncbi:MAG: methyltransferase [Flavobacteriales bacterium]|nr:methyltransferase [Flavobacteriales bacterium]MBK7270226.1 methyltransferase [Flavobacteriales bacterium]MBK9537335.1 methyltransferase [Flavobacteriales bacterium]
MPKAEFRFKQFTVRQERCSMKVSTDGVLFGAWVDYAGATRILDIGTGTGLLALISAQRNAQARIDALEIDDDAAAQAAENMAASPWADRVRVHRADARRVHAGDPYDLILCNPPYYSGYSTSPDARIGLAKHSGELTFPQLIAAVEKHLAPDGRLAVIIPANREEQFLPEAGRIGLAPSRRCLVRYVSHRPPKRVLLELDRGGATTLESEMTIEATGPFDYTPEYRALIGDLMLNF